MNLLQLINFIFLLVFVENAVLESPYIVKFNSVTCSGNPNMLVNITCKLKPLNWEQTLLIMDSDLVDVIRNCTLNIPVFKNTGTQFRPYMLNVTMNLCKTMKFGQGNPYIKVLLQAFTRYTNLNHTCPYSGHLKGNVYFTSSEIPFIMPYGKYKFEFNFYEGWPLVPIGSVHLIVSVFERNRRKI